MKKNYITLILLLLILIIRVITGKYDEGILEIILWILVVIFPLAGLMLSEVSFLSSERKFFFVYFLAAFLLVFLAQPLIWISSKIGYLLFFRYSAVIFLPIELVFMYKILIKNNLNNKKLLVKNSTIDELKKIIDKYPRGNFKDQEDEQIAKRCQELVGQNKVEESIQLYRENNFDTEKNNDLLLLLQQLNFYKNQRRIGLVSEDSFRTIMNNINNALLAVYKAD